MINSEAFVVVRVSLSPPCLTCSFFALTMHPKDIGLVLTQVHRSTGPVRVGARSGLGPIWAHIWAHMGPYGPIYGPIWAHVGPYGSSWTGLGKSVNFPSTFRRDFRTNFARFGSKTKILMKFLNDSASFLLEKLKNHVILTKNLNI